MLALVVAFLVMQASYMGATNRLVTGIATNGVRLVDALSVAASMAWALALIGNLSTGGRYVRNASPAVREILEDELTKSNRSTAFRVGFVAMFLGTCGLFAFSLFSPSGALAVLPLLIALGAAVPVLAFVFLDRRGEG